MKFDEQDKVVMLSLAVVVGGYLILFLIGMATIGNAQCPDDPVYSGGASPSAVMAIYAVDSTMPIGGRVYAVTRDHVVCDVSPVQRQRSGLIGTILHIAPNEDGEPVPGDVIELRADWLGGCGYLPMVGYVVYTPQVLDWEFTIAKPGDLNRDGVIDSEDVYAWHSAMIRHGVVDPTVHYDVSGDCQETWLDLSMLIEVAYRGGDPAILKYGCEQ